MRKKSLALLAISVLSLVGCKDAVIKNENAIYVSTSYDKSVIEINSDTYKYMRDEGFTFTVLLYHSYCSSCQKATENLANVTRSLGYTTYQFDTGYNIVDDDKDVVYPFLYVINKGEVSYKSLIEDVTNYDSLKRLINAYSLKTNITTLNTLDAYNRYKKDHSEFMIYTYDSRESSENDCYTNLVYPSSLKSNKSLLIIDKMSAEKALFEEICKDLGSSQDSDFYHIVTVENGQKKTVAEYRLELRSNIENLVFSFFNIDSVDSAS